MSLESDIKAAVADLFDGKVYADIHPQELNFSQPFLVHTQVGGRPSNTMCGNTDKQNAIVQFNVWANDSAVARSLIREVEKRLTQPVPALNATSTGSAVTLPGPATRTFGARQDFSFWYTP